MEKLTLVKDIYADLAKYDGKDIAIGGWVRSIRDNNKFCFIVVNDGTCFDTIQVVYHDDADNYADIAKLNVSSAVIARGKLVATPDAQQPFELQATKIEIEGTSTPDYPIQKKGLSMEYLRTMPHLRVRTNTFMAVFRIRSLVAYAIHKFFQEQGFAYVHAPLITSSDCEGAGEMFQVTTLDLDRVGQDGKPNYDIELLGHQAFLTVSGQLHVEPFALAMRNTYTFGPTFRAENSHTARHAAEFWMIEPEMAFADLDDLIAMEEAWMKYLINYTLENAPSEMAFLDKYVENGLIDRLKKIASDDFARITYTEAIELLEKAVAEGVKFENPVSWGIDLNTEHERYITEKIFNKPVFVTDYPKEIKSFYMKQNPDGKTVAACDCLVPGVGEIMGGSQREEDYDKLLTRMNELNLDLGLYDYYLDIRKYGTARHSGCGLGFERILMYMTGISNIRDVLPYPRTAGLCEY